MAEEITNTEVPQATDAEPNEKSVVSGIDSEIQKGGESSAVTSDGGPEKFLEQADVLMEQGSKAAKENDYSEAADCFSRALEIRAAHYGELAPECVNAYYKYGCALLYKAQEEADPLAAMPKRENGESQQDSSKEGSIKSIKTGESSVASASSNDQEEGSSDHVEKAPVTAAEAENNEDDEGDSDNEDLAEGDEDESDLDLAWKMLDVARAIVEKQSGDTMELVDILSALAEVALEREDVETSLSDYLKALSILERLVEPDNRRIAELNFRICLCLEIGSKPQEAMPYCQKAISVCKSRVERLANDIDSASGSTASLAPVLEQAVQPLSASQSVESSAEKESEIETLNGLASELEKKLEDLQQLVANPPSILSDILGIVSAKAREAERGAASVAMSSSQIGIANSNGGLDSPTVSTAHTNGAAGVTHLGVVGRGVKRVQISSVEESASSKRPAVEPRRGDGSAS